MVDPRETFADLTLAQFSEVLSSAEPVPGGGSAAAVVASIGASLLAMVARLSVDRPKYEAYQATNRRALEFADTSRARLLRLADEDARAYAGFAAARRMAREDPADEQARKQAMQLAARASSDAPMDVVRECGRVLEEVAAVAGRSNVNASSDLEVAARLAAAAAHGAGSNVLINLPMVGDERYAGAVKIELNKLLREIDRTLAMVTQHVAAGTLRDPEPH